MTWCLCVEASGDDGKAQGGDTDSIFHWVSGKYTFQLHLSDFSASKQRYQEQIDAPSLCFYLWWAADKPDRTFVGLSLMTFSYGWVNYFSLLHEAEATEAHAVLTSESAGLMMLWHVSTQD